jgi:uncharacterized integral membrane protein
MKKAEIAKYAKITAGALVGILFILVILQNMEQVEAELLFVSVKMPLALLVAVTFLLGAGFGFLGGGLYVRRRAKAADAKSKGAR